MSCIFKNVRINVDFLFFAMLSVSALTDENAMTLWGLAAAAVHECAHLAAMKMCRIEVRKIRIRCCGVEIEAFDENAGLKERMFCAGAGIAVNLFFAIAGWGFERFAAANLAMGLISVLPVKPLDGGTMLSILTERIWGADRSDVICTVCSFVFLVPMAAGALVLAMRSKYNCSLLALCVCSVASIFEGLLS